MKFKVDTSLLNAGDTIEQADCEKVIGFSRDSNKYEYQFQLMQLAEHIQRDLWKNGKRYTVVSSGGTVRILTHLEASEYNESRFDLAIAKMRRCNRRLLAVDDGKFDPAACAAHEKAIRKTSSILSAIASKKEEIKVEAHQNKMPSMMRLVGKN